MLNRHESSYKPHIIEKAKVTGEPTPKHYSKLANQLVNDVFQVNSYLGFVALSLDFAKDPQLLEHLSIQTGFGGSVNPNINLRIPAYAIPAIHMVENIQKVLESRNLPATLPTIRLAFAPHAAI